MRKYIFYLFLLLPVLGYAQTHSYCPTDGACTWTGANTFGANVAFAPHTFASLGAPANGTLLFCSDCTPTSPTAGSGNGAFVRRENGAWNAGGAGGSNTQMQFNNLGVLSGDGDAVYNPATHVHTFNNRVNASPLCLGSGDPDTPCFAVSTLHVGQVSLGRSNGDESALVYAASFIASGAVSAAGLGGTAINASANHAVCWKTTSTLGYCSTVPDAGGVCVCN